MHVFISIQSLFLLLSVALTTTIRTTMGCSCLVWPTLDAMIQDENVYIFRGIVVPRFLSLFSSSTNSNNSPSTKYTVRIQEVYKNGCAISDDSDGGSGTSFPLPNRKKITIISPINSCGISPLARFRSFLFTGVVTTVVSDSTNGNNDRSARTLLQQQQQGPEKPARRNEYYNTAPISTDASKNIVRNRILRRTVSTNNSPVVTMDVDLCSNFIQLWRTVTPTERDALSKLKSTATNATIPRCSSDN